MAKPKYPPIPIDEALQAEIRDDVIAINRSAAVVKGGRRFSFSALSVVGNGDGLVGSGYGKGCEVPNAVEKSVKDGRKRLMRVLRKGTSIPHQVEASFCASRVRLIPAANSCTCSIPHDGHDCRISRGRNRGERGGARCPV